MCRGPSKTERSKAVRTDSGNSLPGRKENARVVAGEGIEIFQEEAQIVDRFCTDLSPNIAGLVTCVKVVAS